MGPSKQYRIWQFVAASPHPVSCAEIAAGIGVTEVSVRSVVWNIAHRHKAICNVGGGRGSRSEPLWMANPDIVLQPASAQKFADEDRVEVPALQRYAAHAERLGKWPPCELARIYGLEADSSTTDARTGISRRGVAGNRTGAL
jgi:hypothetical protein